MINQKALEELQTLWEAKQGQEHPTGLSTLPLDSLEILPELYQSRTNYEDSNGVVDTYHVAQLVAALKASRGNELDPIKVLKVGPRNIVVDGHHRLKAYRDAGRQGIPVEWAVGSPQQALLAAGAENKKARLQMTALERSERAWTLVTTGLFTKRQEMEGSGVAEGTISAMRRKLKELQEAGEEIPDTWREANKNKKLDPDWMEKKTQEWAKGITKAFGAPTTFKNHSLLEILSDAFIAWSPRLAQQLALNLVNDLGLQNEAEELDRIRREEIAEDDVDANALGF